MKTILKNNGIFLGLSICFILVLGWAIQTYPKVEMHLWLNGTHSAVGDFIWHYYTYVGEWVPYVIVALLLFYKAGWSAFLLTDVLISGLISQRLKYVFDTDRPLTYFANNAPDIQLQLVDGVRMSEYYSFPSGHTTTFFAMMMALCLVLGDWMCKNNHTARTWIHSGINQLMLFILAIAGGYSRIYLNQHFAEDIWGGAIIGIISTMMLYFMILKWEKSRWWNWNLQKIKKK